MKSAAYWIKTLDLKPHPEGGYYRETYRSNETIPSGALHTRYGGDRSFSTAVYYLLLGHQVSLFHRIKSDEVWHFYCGSSLQLMLISSTGQYSEINLGPNPESKQQFQWVIPAGVWFAAKVVDVSSFALVGCTVAPGFDFKDLEFAKQDELIRLCPTQKELIKALTKN